MLRLLETLNFERRTEEQLHRTGCGTFENVRAKRNVIKKERLSQIVLYFKQWKSRHRNTLGWMLEFWMKDHDIEPRNFGEHRRNLDVFRRKRRRAATMSAQGR